jgi:hypothetical protein
MTPREAETLTQLVYDAAGTRGSGLTYVQLAQRSRDEESGYQPSANLLHKIGTGQEVKLNERLVRAIAAGLGLPVRRVQAAAARQYLGFEAVDPGLGGGGDEDEVIRAARKTGVTPSDGSRVEGFVRQSRSDDLSDEG